MSWDFAEAAVGGTPSQTSAESQDRPCRVLVVEDHTDSARLTARVLKGLGYEVKTAGCAAEAIRLASTEAFDVVVGDVGLPDMCGCALMRQLWNRFGLLGVAVTGYDDQKLALSSKDSGFLEHLVKPIDVKRLHEAIQKVVIGKNAAPPHCN